MKVQSLEMAGVGLQTAGLAFTVMGTYDQSARQKDVLQYEAAVAGNNAVVAEYQASQAKLIGEQLIVASRLKTAQTISSARVQLAANGIDLGYGTATDVLATTAYVGDRDTLTIQDNTNRQVWAYKVQAQNYLSEKSVDEAMSDSISPLRNAATSLLGGAAGVIDSYSRYKAATIGR